MKKIFFSLLVFSLLHIGCQSATQKNTPSSQNHQNGMSHIVVKEVINGTTYSYLRGDNGSKEIWVAIRKQPVEVGKTYYYTNPLEMNNFHSKELNKDFDHIYFLNSISDGSASQNPFMGSSPHGTQQNPHMMKPTAKKVEVSIDLEEGITSIENVYKNKKTLANSVIAVKGKVTKFNANIMGKNWIHIQDGTEFGKNFDLTITSNDMVSIGQVVEFKGNLVLDKDFGAGYSYPVIMENAKIVK